MTWAACADPAIGFDLAHWQGIDIPWKESMRLGCEWMIAKTWHGRGLVKTAQPQIDSAREAGLSVLGRYAWILPDDDLDAQVKAWLSIKHEWDELPITLDWEHPDTKLRGRALLDRLEYVVEKVSDAIGERPIVYSGNWYWVGYCGDLDSEISASCPLHLAAYPRKSAEGTRYREAVAEVCGGVMPRVPKPWRDRAFDPLSWQMDGDTGLYLPQTADGKKIDVDVNVAARTRLLALVARVPPRREPGPTQPDTAANPIGWETRAERDAAEVAAATDPEKPTSEGGGES